MKTLEQIKKEARDKYVHYSPDIGFYMDCFDSTDLEEVITTAYNAGLDRAVEKITHSAKSCKECKKPIHIHPHDFYDNELDCNCTRM